MFSVDSFRWQAYAAIAKHPRSGAASAVSTGLPCDASLHNCGRCEMTAAVVIGLVALLGVGLVFAKGPIAEISLPAEPIASVLGFQITNTMLAAWLTILV